MYIMDFKESSTPTMAAPPRAMIERRDTKESGKEHCARNGGKSKAHPYEAHEHRVITLRTTHQATHQVSVHRILLYYRSQRLRAPRSVVTNSTLNCKRGKKETSKKTFDFANHRPIHIALILFLSYSFLISREHKSDP